MQNVPVEFYRSPSSPVVQTTIDHASPAPVDPLVAAQRAYDAKIEAQARLLDSYVNNFTRQGWGNVNAQNGANYILTRLKDPNILNALFRNSWLAKRIIEAIPQTMLKAWIKWEGELTPEEIELIHEHEDEIALRANLLRGLNWGRLYGGAVGLMMIEGQDDRYSLEQPLDIDSIMPGDFKGLLITDRWSGVYPDVSLVSELGHEFGLPEYYKFQANQYGLENFNSIYRVHHSRIIRFTGCELPEWERVAEVYWGSSVLEAIIEDLKRWDSTSTNMCGLIFLKNILVHKKEGLPQLLAATNQKTKQDFQSTMEAQTALMNNFGRYVISEKDEMEILNFSLTDVPEAYELFKQNLSGASKIPLNILFGQDERGMSSTGEGDVENWDHVIETEQDNVLRPILNKLKPVLLMSSIGKVPRKAKYSFNPIRKPTDKDLADQVKTKTESILAVHTSGIFSDRKALIEIKNLSESTGMYTSITDEDIAAASDEIIKMDMSEGDSETDAA